ncbi:MAG: hypothetical protein PHR53_09605 [Bacteroidales bacterium]|nr:hypothetical protein [Bacteroidales bacterium]
MSPHLKKTKELLDEVVQFACTKGYYDNCHVPRYLRADCLENWLFTHRTNQKLDAFAIVGCRCREGKIYWQYATTDELNSQMCEAIEDFLFHGPYLVSHIVIDMIMPYTTIRRGEEIIIDGKSRIDLNICYHNHGFRYNG